MGGVAIAELVVEDDGAAAAGELRRGTQVVMGGARPPCRRTSGAGPSGDPGWSSPTTWYQFSNSPKGTRPSLMGTGTAGILPGRP